MLTCAQRPRTVSSQGCSSGLAVTPLAGMDGLGLVVLVTSVDVEVSGPGSCIKPRDGLWSRSKRKVSPLHKWRRIYFAKSLSMATTIWRDRNYILKGWVTYVVLSFFYNITYKILAWILDCQCYLDHLLCTLGVRKSCSSSSPISRTETAPWLPLT